jgi:hypothetical protein
MPKADHVAVRTASEPDVVGEVVKARADDSGCVLFGPLGVLPSPMN